MSQNINEYNFKKFYLKLIDENNDICLASDEVDFNQEVVFSPYLIAQTDGNILPIYVDLNDSDTSQRLNLSYGNYSSGNTLVSSNYWNPDNLDLSCFTAETSCDIGLTGIDNGLVKNMTGETITFKNGFFDDSLKFDRYHFDRRFKFFQVTGYTQSPNQRFSGIPDNTLYEVVSKTGSTIGVYNELYGGFYQGFYKLFGYDYETYPERTSLGWSVELILKPRFVNEYTPSSGNTLLNTVYPNNAGMFFYMGARAENKFYHFASGHPLSDSGYTRVTETLADCLYTCKCTQTGQTNSRCLQVYQTSAQTIFHATGCTCGCGEEVIISTEQDPKYDSMSNAIGVRFSGDPRNPIINIRILRFTGDCITTGSCETTGITYSTGYTIDNYYTDIGINKYCVDNYGIESIDKESWYQIDIVWQRYTWLDYCDLQFRGGLGDITTFPYLLSLANDSVQLIEPPVTNGEMPAERIEVVQLNEKWLLEKNFRMGKLKVYVNGKIVKTFENVEEIIPRGLSTEKEKQVGVPFNISWGGGTQGLRENLTFTGCPTTLTGLTYQQDPECFPNNVLSGTSLSGLTTNILLERNFAGTFEGGISQFRLYTKPLSAPEVKHNFLLLKDKFTMFNPDCPNCNLIPVTPTPTPSNTPTPTPTPTTPQTPTPTPTITASPTLTPTITPTPSSTPPPQYDAYLFIEPISAIVPLGQYMVSNGFTWGGFNLGVPSINQNLFNNQLNAYISFSGWSNGLLPAVQTEPIPQNSGGVDNYGNSIVAYNFTTHRVSAGTVNEESWFTWIIPTDGTNNLKQTQIGFNFGGDASSLTTANMNSTIYNLIVNYTGSTIPQGTYKVYTTKPNTIFRNNNVDAIYFKGNQVS